MAKGIAPKYRMSITSNITVSVWEKATADGVLWLSVCLRESLPAGNKDTHLFVSDLQGRPRKDETDPWADVDEKVKKNVLKQSEKRLLPVLAAAYPSIVSVTQEV